MKDVSIEDRFLFDLQGFLLLRGVLSKAECSAYEKKLRTLEANDYADSWQEALPPGPPGRPTRETHIPHQTRLNGLPRLDEAL
jgi:hypothetical protein